MDDGESIEKTAIREVQEETGIQNLVLLVFLWIPIIFLRKEMNFF